MLKVKNIDSLLLSKINFEKNEDVYDTYNSSDSENSLFASLNGKIEKIGFHTPDDCQYRALLSISGLVTVGDGGKNNEKKVPVLANVLIGYQIDFETDKPMPHADNEHVTLDSGISDELSDIIEPYYRETLQSLFERSSLEMPPLPYRMRRLKNE